MQDLFAVIFVDTFVASRATSAILLPVQFFFFKLRIFKITMFRSDQETPLSHYCVNVRWQ